jgi:hypothetical protein
MNFQFIAEVFEKQGDYPLKGLGRGKRFIYYKRVQGVQGSRVQVKNRTC